MPGPGGDPGTGGYGRLRRPEGWPPYGLRARGIFPIIKDAHANLRRGVVTPPYGLRLCAHRRGGIYAARGFAWAAVGGSVVGEGFIPPGMSTAAQASAGRRGRRPLQQSVGGMSTERRPVGAGHARPGGWPGNGRLREVAAARGLAALRATRERDFSCYKGSPQESAVCLLSPLPH